MNFMKYRTLWIGCGLSLVLTAASSVLLAGKISSVNRADSDLRAALKKHKQLAERTVYPNSINLESAGSNLAKLSAALSNALDRLRSGQVEGVYTPDDFAPMVESVVKKLKKSAESNGVNLPTDFGFGFDAYLKRGLKPDVNALPRLSSQLRTTASICEILYGAKVSNVISVAREEFESTEIRNSAAANGSPSVFPGRAESGPSHTSYRDISTPASNNMYVVERYGIEFIGRENAVWEVLNQFAKGPPFVVVRDAQIDADLPGFGASVSKNSLNPSSGIGGVGASGRLGAPKIVTIATNLINNVDREDRIVAGRESVKVSLVLDVFLFTGPPGNTR